MKKFKRLEVFIKLRWFKLLFELEFSIGVLFEIKVFVNCLKFEYMYIVKCMKYKFFSIWRSGRFC